MSLAILEPVNLNCSTQMPECNNTCMSSRECAQHYTAGDFRTEDGNTPNLIVKDGNFCCDRTFLNHYGATVFDSKEGTAEEYNVYGNTNNRPHESYRKHISEITGRTWSNQALEEQKDILFQMLEDANYLKTQSPKAARTLATAGLEILKHRNLNSELEEKFKEFIK